jgi:hypothetical protein
MTNYSRNLSGQVSTKKVELKVQKETNTLNNRIDTVISDINTVLVSLNESLVTNTTDIGNLQTVLNTNTLDLSTLATYISTNTSDIGTITTAVGTNTSDISTINSNISTLQGNEVIPSHTDNSGKLLTSNGTVSSWTDSFTVSEVTISGTTRLKEVIETVEMNTDTTGNENISLMDSSIIYLSSVQTGNRTLNFIGDGSTDLNDVLSDNESISCTVLLTNGATPYYIESISIDGTLITSKWQGGSAPTAGTASGIDLYSFSIIKIADATFVVLASISDFS